MKIRKKYEIIAENALNLIYPHRCPICHEILTDQSGRICPECFKNIQPVTEPMCRCCGRPVAEEQEKCRDCQREERHFTEGRGIFLYSEKMRRSIVLFKYDGRREYGRFFSMAMSVYAQTEMRRWKPDLLIPIPLHKRKQRQRGFNQAEILARKIGEQYGIKVDTSVLVKRIPTRAQKKLSAKERKRNLRQAFAVRRQVSGLRILLVDDVFTTGSTIDAAAACLLKAGASMVFFLTLCIAAEDERI